MAGILSLITTLKSFFDEHGDLPIVIRSEEGELADITQLGVSKVLNTEEDIKVCWLSTHLIDKV